MARARAALRLPAGKEAAVGGSAKGPRATLRPRRHREVDAAGKAAGPAGRAGAAGAGPGRRERTAAQGRGASLATGKRTEHVLSNSTCNSCFHPRSGWESVTPRPQGSSPTSHGPRWAEGATPGPTAYGTVPERPPGAQCSTEDAHMPEPPIHPDNKPSSSNPHRGRAVGELLLTEPLPRVGWKLLGPSWAVKI